MRIAYRTIGEGPTRLVFLHPWGASGTGGFWDPLLNELDLTGLQVVLPDIRGHGASGKTRDGYNISRLAADIIGVLDDILARDVVLVGHSVGARSAQYVAATAPDRVRGQVLLAPVPADALPLTDEVLESWLYAAKDRTRWEALVAQFTSELLPPSMIDAFFAEVSLADDWSLAGLYKTCRTDSFVELLGAIVAPTLVVAGVHDPGFPIAFVATTVHQKITGARMARVNAGHYIPLERPLESASLIEAFVAALRRQGH